MAAWSGLGLGLGLGLTLTLTNPNPYPNLNPNPNPTPKPYQVRALCPLAFPRAADAPLGNDWCFVDVPMPCGLATMVQRLAASNLTRTR